MEIFIYTSVGIVVIAFCILVFYIVSTLKTVNKSVYKISSTVERMENQLKGITKETEELLHKTNIIVDDLQVKTDKLSTVVNAVQDVGTTIQKFNRQLNGVSNSVIHQVEKNEEKISQIVQIGNIVMGIKEKWDEIKLRKQKEKNVTAYHEEERSYSKGQ